MYKLLKCFEYKYECVMYFEKIYLKITTYFESLFNKHIKAGYVKNVKERQNYREQADVEGKK